METNEKQSWRCLKLALWIHCGAQFVMAATVVSYVAHLQQHFVHAYHMTALPVITHCAFHWRHAVWLIPVIFAAVALRMSVRKKLESATLSMYTAFSMLAIACTIALAVLATRAPFGYPPTISPP